MEAFLCITCGTQYPESHTPPEHCLICEEERQYVGLHGQQWTTLGQLRTSHRNNVTAEEPSLTAFSTEPHFAIGQRSFLIETPEGNVLWDCISLLDDDTVTKICERGGLAAIAISHPH